MVVTMTKTVKMLIVAVLAVTFTLVGAVAPHDVDALENHQIPLAQEHIPSSVVQRIPDSRIANASITPQPGLAFGSTTCFASLDVCNKETDSCTRRGQCVESRTGCFRCQCVRHFVDDNGKADPKITGIYLWTGTRCDKRDVSVPFQLFFWFTIVFIALLIASIKLLASAGDSAPKGVGTRMVVRSKME